MANIRQVPYAIGITGTIGSGKSLVGRFLNESGVPVLDTDQVVHELYASDTMLKQQIADRFGPRMITPDGTIDRKALGALVFKDTARRKELEGLVHPRVGEKVDAFIRTSNPATPLRGVLVPLLFEAGLERKFNETWAITVSPESVLVNRLMGRDNLSPEEVQNRLNAQLPQAEKARRATRVIDNSGTPEATREQVRQALTHIQEHLDSCNPS